MAEELGLLAETRELLNSSPLSMRRISEDTGINVWWLRKFKIGAFADPGVSRVETLRNFLRAKQSSSDDSEIMDGNDCVSRRE